MSMTPNSTPTSRELTDAVMGNVAAPPDAVGVGEWEDALTPDAFRLFWGSDHTVDGADITISGTQSADGSIDERHITIVVDHVTAEAARAIAAALVEAADEIDRLAAGR